MKTRFYIPIIICLIGLSPAVIGQVLKDRIRSANSDTNLTFTGTRTIERDDDHEGPGHFILGGYISAYYADYSDTAGQAGFQKFPTVAPRKENFGLNMAMFSMKYRSEWFRANAIFHYGDIPLAAWSPTYNNIQEANLGLRLVKNLWLDAGLFRTHIGLESIQPRENVTLSISIPTYFEPYYLSGAKLSYTGFSKLMLQINAFNNFNGYIETNNSKAIGASIVYDPNPKLNFTYNFMTCDESYPGYGDHQRFYNNLIGSLKQRTWTLGFDFSQAFQQNSGLTDTNKTISVYTALMVLKYNFYSSYSIYGRLSYFQDRDEMLTGPIENANHQLVGLDLVGYTLGLEYQPIRNSYLRLESRLLQTTQNETVFYPHKGNSRRRLEIIAGLGVWF